MFECFEEIHFGDLDEKELMGFWSRWRGDVDPEDAVEFFEGVEWEQNDPWQVAKDALETLAAYAVAASCAVGLREKGDIQGAQVYEEHMEIYYSDLPVEVRW